MQPQIKVRELRDRLDDLDQQVRNAEAELRKVLGPEHGELLVRFVKLLEAHHMVGNRTLALLEKGAA
jgi:hypothetical protein